MIQINNLDIYNEGMKQSMEDKLFFLREFTFNFPDVFVDYGCADGTLLQFIKEAHPETDLYGIDMNADMLHLVEKNVGISPDHLLCSPFPQHIEGMFRKETSVINLSSVLHEVYSYCEAEDEHMFWAPITAGDYNYIFIRDMIYNDSATKIASREDIIKLEKGADPEQLAEFESIWGSIKYQKNLLHFLLKYRYKENWKREVRENYLGYSVEDIIKNIGNNYQLVYRKDYTLPFLFSTVKKDFGIELALPTHTNLIFKRK